jgi:hypothetical protein
MTVIIEVFELDVEYTSTSVLCQSEVVNFLISLPNDVVVLLGVGNSNNSELLMASVVVLNTPIVGHLKVFFNIQQNEDQSANVSFSVSVKLLATNPNQP